MLRFGAGMSLTGVVMYAARYVDCLVLGRMLGPVALGFYSRAHQLVVLPIMRSSGALNSVLFPAYAKIQDHPERLRRAFYQNLALISVIVFPALAWLAVMADELIVTVLGMKWEPAIEPFRILCMAGVLTCMSDIGEVVVRAKGVVLARFKRHLLNVLVVGMCVLIGSKWGVTGASAGIVLAVVVQYLMMAQLAIKLVEGNWRDYFRSHSPGFIVALSLGMLTLLTASVLRRNDSTRHVTLAATLLINLSVYTLVMIAFPRQLLPPAAFELVRRSRYLGRHHLKLRRRLPDRQTA
jgi:PST family polysaccharide transporter